MAITGNSKQEEKITKMGQVSHEMFPHIDLLSFKGAFRMGINSALKQKGYAKWKELIDKENMEKRAFFYEILKASNEYLLKLGLTEADTKVLYSRLIKNNETFLSRP